MLTDFKSFTKYDVILASSVFVGNILIINSFSNKPWQVMYSTVDQYNMNTIQLSVYVEISNNDVVFEWCKNRNGKVCSYL